MSEIARTNGDYVRPVIAAAREHLAAVRAWARENPDEVCVTVAPAVAVLLSTRRHQLSFPEALILSELAYWCGALAVSAYRDWKARPAPQPPRLKVA